MIYQPYIDACGKDGQKIERLIRAFYKSQTRRSIFIDGGAHNGYHTNFAAKHYSDRVIAVEASPVIFVELVKQIRQNPPKPGQCEVFPINAALGARATQGDTAQFFYSPSHPGRSTVNTKMWEQWGKGKVEYEAPILAPIVEIDDLVSLFSGGKSVDFIKLDLEGNEINALRGAQNTLRNHKPNIVMEFGLKPNNEHLFGENLSGFHALVKNWGYRVFAPWGEDVSESMLEGYPFWYVFLLPVGERLQSDIRSLRTCFEASISEQG